MWYTSVDRQSRRRQRFTPVMLVAATACMLSACGGGGSEVATIPAPLPTPASPPPPSSDPVAVREYESITSIVSPAKRAATYDAIALIERDGASGTTAYSTAAPGEVRIKIDPVSGDYTLLFASSDLPVASSSHSFEPHGFNYLWDSTTFGNINSIIQEYSDGSTKIVQTDEYRRSTSTIETSTSSSDKLRQTLVYDVGLSHVALGEWMWATIQPNGNATDTGRLYFVHGDRTPGAEIPTSGTATYTAASLGYDDGAPVRIALAADFGQRSISAQLDREGSFSGDAVGGYSSNEAVDAHGTGKIYSPGDFSIPLSGTLGFLSNDLSFTPVPAKGSLDGAFFGPNAQQVGGVFVLGHAPDQAAGQLLVSDAFVGARD